ncbi:MAG TPA: hypothetical protein DF383_02515 [Deltaproteobacteria bacterium]|nr:hypothetical protein [Deltaproteobacteria bacterium]
MPIFKKAALEGLGTDRCSGDGYAKILEDLERTLYSSQDKPIPLDSYLKNLEADSCIAEILSDSKRKVTAGEFLNWLAGQDENKKDLSPFDVIYGASILYRDQFQEEWRGAFTQSRAPYYSALEKVRWIGQSFLDKNSSQELKTKSLLFLQSLAAYVGSLPADDPVHGLSDSLDYFWNQKEPKSFKYYLQIPYHDFLALDETQKRELFKTTLHRKYPDVALTEGLFKFLTRGEAIEFSKIAFQTNILSAFALFEAVPLPRLYGQNDLEQASQASKESDYFPNLPQNYPFKDRQKLIDDFLGKPVFVKRTNFWEAAAQGGVRTTLKKYLWPFNTEVFSIESGRPGPTTLVFSPHFHEDNPRKQFHWTKDIPLKTGRILLIPEANREMFRQKKDTNPMNRLFDKALMNDSADYLIVRRVERLMGLVDGMVGHHDASKGPFYISDMVKTHKSGNNVDPAPVASPYVPSAVKNIQGISVSTQDTSTQVAPQLQWQIAAFSRERLEKLYGEKFSFDPEDINDASSHSADSATGYMNFHLGKPAMTFEGRKGAEHGQLHATALYTLLLAFGHEIDGNFEEVLKKSYPTVNKEIYEGLPVRGEPTKRRPSQKAAALKQIQK